MEIPELGYDIRIEGLTKEDLEALMEKVKSAVVQVLPERIGSNQVMVTPHFTREAE